MVSKLISVVIAVFLLAKTGFCQSDTLSPAKLKNRKIALLGSSAAITAGSLVYLDQAWYQQYNTGKFHFFNDNAEWLQMDKAGHMFTTFQTGRLMMNAFEHAGFSRKQKLFIGGASGFFYMTMIECMDGFSKGWGFSWGDETANILGTSLAVSQEAFWGEQKIQLKFSYWPSGLAKYNPEILGKNGSTQILKDYNGQTYWLSFNPFTLFKKDTKFPAWLNLAFGYGAYGMLDGSDNNIAHQDVYGNPVNFQRERRFYLSLDLDLTKIKTKSRFLKHVFSAFNMVKFPAPTLQFGQKGSKAYFIHF